jgi:hypothetical protein
MPLRTASALPSTKQIKGTFVFLLPVADWQWFVRIHGLDTGRGFKADVLLMIFYSKFSC